MKLSYLVLGLILVGAVAGADEIAIDTIQMQGHVISMDQICKRGNYLETTANVVGTRLVTIPGEYHELADGGLVVFSEPKTVKKHVNYGILKTPIRISTEVCTFRPSLESECLQTELRSSDTILTYTIKEYHELGNGGQVVFSEKTQRVPNCR